MPGKILVTGGAGYIGSHVCKALHAKEYEPIVLDNLSTGNRKSVLWGRFFEGELERESLNSIFAEHQIRAVVHCAAKAVVDEAASVLEYYESNVVGTLNLLEAMTVHGVKRIVFTSTVAGRESLYGSTKKIAEDIVTQYKVRHGIECVILRLQNVAGASPDGDIGERHNPETHLIPNACLAALGKKGRLTVYGDGESLRDYVHVMDVAEEIVNAVEGEGSTVLGVGSGLLTSVNSVIERVEKISGKKITVEYVGERKGDAEGAETSPCYRVRRNINDIIESALKWHGR